MAPEVDRADPAGWIEGHRYRLCVRGWNQPETEVAVGARFIEHVHDDSNVRVPLPEPVSDGKDLLPGKTVLDAHV